MYIKSQGGGIQPNPLYVPICPYSHGVKKSDIAFTELMADLMYV